MRDSTDHSTGGQYRLVSNGKKVPAARHDTPGEGRLLLCRLDARPELCRVQGVRRHGRGRGKSFSRSLHLLLPRRNNLADCGLTVGRNATIAPYVQSRARNADCLGGMVGESPLSDQVIECHWPNLTHALTICKLVV